MKRPTLDTIVNVAILVTCVATVTVIVERYRTGSAAASPSTPDSMIGKSAPTLEGVDYRRQPSTVLLFVNSSCRFCTQSMPLYQTLAKDKKNKPGLKLVAVSAESVDVTRAYLNAHDVSVDDIVVHASSIPTPTLLLVDQAGIIQQNWVGWQDDTASRDLLQKIGIHQ